MGAHARLDLIIIFFYNVVLNGLKIWTGDDSNQRRGRLTTCDVYRRSGCDVRAKLLVGT